MSDPDITCCADMARELSRKCDLHGDDPFECADRVIYKASDGRYGLIIHDGGSSWYKINYCPWCGARVSL